MNFCVLIQNIFPCENFAASGALIAARSMLLLYVLKQLCPLAELLFASAVPAHILLLAAVHAPVLFKFRRRHERLAANPARVLAARPVRAHMCSQILVLAEPRAAPSRRARIPALAMHRHVPLQVLVRHEPLPAPFDATHILLPQIRIVAPHMHRQVRLPHVRLLAPSKRARVRPLARVRPNVLRQLARLPKHLRAELAPVLAHTRYVDLPAHLRPPALVESAPLEIAAAVQICLAQLRYRPLYAAIQTDQQFYRLLATDFFTTDIGATDFYAADIGATDIFAADIGAADFFTTDIGATDFFTAEISAIDFFTVDISAIEFLTRFFANINFVILITAQFF
ncbi:hypothetical protein AYI69_g1097 [Smittium culicis]|uniref:Uncharacterized protein n=1 Tax=Smittium culicis TaxID=133412 RepID=A0A1R1YR66_9FUNG|nr:hypothetical protein AYI69_g1097 [Smittium culicis]